MRSFFCRNLQRKRLHRSLHQGVYTRTFASAVNSNPLSDDPFPFSDDEDEFPSAGPLPAVKQQVHPEAEDRIHCSSPPQRRGPSSLLKPPFHNQQDFVESFLNSPQLTYFRALPVLSSCLPPSSLLPPDHEWMNLHLPSVKQALGLPLIVGRHTAAAEESKGDSLEIFPSESTSAAVDDGEGEAVRLPLTESHASAVEEGEGEREDALLYLAFQHLESSRSLRAKYVRLAHSRLWFLGQYVVELALVEYFLQRYPRELSSCIRDRVQALTRIGVLPQYMGAAGLTDIIFKGKAEGKVLSREITNKLIRAVFWSLIGVSYLSKGMGEVYRLLFEVFGLNPDDKTCQPKPRQRFRDDDHVFADLEEPLSWQVAAVCKTKEDALFAKPLLYRACVPPGMKRFRGNSWEVNNLSLVLETLHYPLQAVNEDPLLTDARNAELELGLQLCFLDFSMYKEEHPRFCNERLRYLGSKIQDVTMAEKLLLKHLDGPGTWLREQHRKFLLNRLCGVYFREKKLHNHIIYPDERRELVNVQIRLRNFASIVASQALLGLGYSVYGKAEVRRLMFRVFQYQQRKRSKKLQRHV